MLSVIILLLSVIIEKLQEYQFHIKKGYATLRLFYTHIINLFFKCLAQ